MDKDILDIIRSRRSIRAYKPDTLSAGLIRDILEAGRWAPSGLNNQPWRFLVIKDKNKIEKVAGFTKYSKAIKAASVLIVVCMDTADSYNRDKDLMAIGACIENMLLCASSLGVGSCWMGEILNKKAELARSLKLGDDLEVAAVITLGYPDAEIAQGCRKQLKALIIDA